MPEITDEQASKLARMEVQENRQKENNRRRNIAYRQLKEKYPEDFQRFYDAAQLSREEGGTLNKGG